MNTYKKWYDQLVFLDLETSGLSAFNDKIIQVGIVVLDSNFNKQVEYDTFIHHPGLVLSNTIVELTKITDEDLKTGISEEELVNLLCDLFKDNTLILAYNAQFDLSFIYHLLRRYDKHLLFNYPDYLDVLTVYKSFAKYPHKLLNAIDYFHLSDKVINSHRATDDTFAMVEVFKAMIENGIDTVSFINKFGYNPKYGISYQRLPKLEYFAQYYIK